MLLLKLLKFEFIAPGSSLVHTEGPGASLTPCSPPLEASRGGLSRFVSADLLNMWYKTWLPSWSQCIFACLDSKALCNVAPHTLSSFHSSQLPASPGSNSSLASLLQEAEQHCYLRCAFMGQARVPPLTPGNLRKLRACPCSPRKAPQAPSLP